MMREVKNSWIYLFLLSFYRKLRDGYFFLKRKKYLRTINTLIPNDISIISSNCLAGRIMQDKGMKYNSPTLGLFIMGPDFNEFVLHLKHYLTDAKLQFVEHSKWPVMDERRARWKHWYPIGWLDGGKVEIHFLHYFTEEEAAEKWYKRARRVNYDKLLILASQQNLATVQDIKDFEKLPYKWKFIFSSIDIKGDSIIYMPEFDGLGKVGDPYSKGHLFYKHLIEKLKKNENIGNLDWGNT